MAPDQNFSRAISRQSFSDRTYERPIALLSLKIKIELREAVATSFDTSDDREQEMSLSEELPEESLVMMSEWLFVRDLLMLRTVNSTFERVSKDQAVGRRVACHLWRAALVCRPDHRFNLEASEACSEKFKTGASKDIIVEYVACLNTVAAFGLCFQLSASNSNFFSNRPVEQ